jgi:hypothetical protein
MTTTSNLQARINSSSDDGTLSCLLNYNLAAIQTERSHSVEVDVGPTASSVDISFINSIRAIIVVSTVPVDVSIFFDGAEDVFTGSSSNFFMRVFQTEQVLTQLKVRTPSAEGRAKIMILGSRI